MSLFIYLGYFWLTVGIFNERASYSLLKWCGNFYESIIVLSSDGVSGLLFCLCLSSHWKHSYSTTHVILITWNYLRFKIMTLTMARLDENINSDDSGRHRNVSGFNQLMGFHWKNNKLIRTWFLAAQSPLRQFSSNHYWLLAIYVFNLHHGQTITWTIDSL
jgi:hypothetical protein